MTERNEHPTAQPTRGGEIAKFHCQKPEVLGQLHFGALFAATLSGRQNPSDKAMCPNFQFSGQRSLGLRFHSPFSTSVQTGQCKAPSFLREELPPSDECNSSVCTFSWSSRIHLCPGTLWRRGCALPLVKVLFILPEERIVQDVIAHRLLHLLS